MRVKIDFSLEVVAWMRIAEGSVYIALHMHQNWYIPYRSFRVGGFKSRSHSEKRGYPWVIVFRHYTHTQTHICFVTPVISYCCLQGVFFLWQHLTALLFSSQLEWLGFLLAVDTPKGNVQQCKSFFLSWLALTKTITGTRIFLAGFQDVLVNLCKFRQSFTWNTTEMNWNLATEHTAYIFYRWCETNLWRYFLRTEKFHLC